MSAVILRLRLGDMVFDVEKTTLLRVEHTYFCGLLSSGGWPPDEDGTYFIDRPATGFDRIIEYLKSDVLSVEGLTPEEEECVYDSLDYLLIPPPWTHIDVTHMSMVEEAKAGRDINVKAMLFAGRDVMEKGPASPNAFLLIQLIINGIHHDEDTPPLHANGSTALHEAVLWGHESMVILLLSNGADVHAKAYRGFTPLHIAASKGYESLAILLLAKGADVLAESSDGSTSLHTAVESSEKSMIRLLISKGANVLSKNHDGWTPLHRAACSYTLETARILLVNGADVMARDNNGSTPLHKAARSGYDSSVRLLIGHGADVLAKDNDGKTPLDIAVTNYEEETASLLRTHMEQAIDDERRESSVCSVS